MADTVEIFEYDPNWPILFTREKDRILKITRDKVQAIEHMGSTAVPGLAAKPIVDIMAGVPRLSDAMECILPLREIGYEYVPEAEKFIPERRYFHKGPHLPNQHFHLHMVEFGGDIWKRHLLFRDYLRAHPDAAIQYCQLKKRLASKFRHDREAYTEAKTSFIESVVAKAKMSEQ